MSTIINARSPYYLKFTDPAEQIEEATIRIYIWSGLKTAPPATATYTIDKTPLTNDTGNFVVVEVSQLIRDYLYTEFYDEAQDAVWVKIDDDLYFGDEDPVTNTRTLLAFDGFGYFEEGINPRNSEDPNDPTFTPMLLQSNMTVYFVSGRDIKIPVFSEPAPTVSTDIGEGKWDGNDNFWNVVDVNWEDVTTNLTITDSNDSADKIQYVIITSEGAVTGDTITFTSTVGASQVQTITLVEICEPRFDKYRSIFYNKFGALQSFWVTKKSVVNTKIKSETYQSNLLDFSGTEPTYDIRKHNQKRFQVTAVQSISTNTPLLKEDQNEPYEQLSLSEQVWLEKEEGDALPVIVKSESITRKTGVNNKVEIQYGIDFDFAYSKINNIR